MLANLIRSWVPRLVLSALPQRTCGLGVLGRLCLVMTPEAVPWQEVLMSVETWKFMAMCVITVNLKQVMQGGPSQCGTSPIC